MHKMKSSVSQRGVALIVVMLFMTVLGLGGLYSARSALMGERLARSQLDVQVARQAAEAALRDGERDLMLTSGAMQSGAACARNAMRPTLDAVAYFDNSCTAGQCSALTESDRINQANYDDAADATKTVVAEAWWPASRRGKWQATAATSSTCTSFTGGVPLGMYTGANQIAGVARQPEYLIEYFTRGEGHYFRITARGFGYRTGTEVVMQSYIQLQGFQ